MTKRNEIERLQLVEHEGKLEILIIDEESFLTAKAQLDKALHGLDDVIGPFETRCAYGQPVSIFYINERVRIKPNAAVGAGSLGTVTEYEVVAEKYLLYIVTFDKPVYNDFFQSDFSCATFFASQLELIKP